MGQAEQVVRGVFGDEVIVVFTAGASGDVTQVDNLSPYRRRAAEESARFVGGRIGAEVVKVLLSVPRSTEAIVDSRSQVLRIKRRVPTQNRNKNAGVAVKAAGFDTAGSRVRLPPEALFFLPFFFGSHFFSRNTPTARIENGRAAFVFQQLAEVAQVERSVERPVTRVVEQHRDRVADKALARR